MLVDDVALAAQGDTGAFERVYQAHLGRVHNLARRMAGPEAADELTQDVFVRLWQKLATFRGESSFTTWLHRLAVNVIIERFRTLGTARERFIADGEAILDRLPASTMPGRYDAAMDLETAMKRLPRGHGQCSCCTTSKGIGTRRSARCLACRSALRNRSCTARG